MQKMIGFKLNKSSEDGIARFGWGEKSEEQLTLFSLLLLPRRIYYQ